MRCLTLLALIALVTQCLAQSNCTSCDFPQSWCVVDEKCVDDCSTECNSTDNLLCGIGGAADELICETDACYESNVCNGCNSGCSWQGTFCASERVNTSEPCSFGLLSIFASSPLTQPDVDSYCRQVQESIGSEWPLGCVLTDELGRRRQSSTGQTVRVYDSSAGSGESVARFAVEDFINNPGLYDGFGIISVELAGADGAESSSDDDDLSGGAIAGIILAAVALVVLVVACIILIVGIAVVVIIMVAVAIGKGGSTDGNENEWTSSEEMSERGKEIDSETQSSSAESDAESDTESDAESDTDEGSDSVSSADDDSSSEASTSNGKDSSSGNSSVSGSSSSDESSDESS